MKNAKEIQNLWKEYKRLAAITDSLEADSMTDDTAAEIWDQAYAEEWETHQKVLEAVEEATGCDEKTARAIVANEAFENLMSMTITD